MSTTSDRADSSSTVPPAEPSPRRPARRPGAALRPLLLRLHFYAGVFVAPFLAVACLTGLVYVFSPQLNDLVYRDELLVGPHSGAAAPARRPDRRRACCASRGHADPRSLTRATPTAPPGVVLAVPRPARRHRSAPSTSTPTPRTVRGSLDTWYDTPPLQTTLDALHRNLLLGEPGRLYSELAASWLWVLARSAAWRCGSGKATPPGAASGRRCRPAAAAERGQAAVACWAGTGAVGVWLAVALLFISATGLTWSNYAGARFQRLSSTPSRAPRRARRRGRPRPRRSR